MIPATAISKLKLYILRALKIPYIGDTILQKWITILQKIEIITEQIDFFCMLYTIVISRQNVPKNLIVRSLDTDDAIKSVIK